MLTVVPVPDQILESPQFSTCHELPLLHQLHGGLPLPLSHNAVVEVLKLCANAGPLGRDEVEEWKTAVLGLSGGSGTPPSEKAEKEPLFKPMPAFSLNPVTTMQPIQSLAPVTSRPPVSLAPVTTKPPATAAPAPAPAAQTMLKAPVASLAPSTAMAATATPPLTPEPVAITPTASTVPSAIPSALTNGSAGVPKGALSPTVMGFSAFSPVRPPAPILRPTVLPPLPSAPLSPVRSVHFDLDDDEDLSLDVPHPKVPAHLSHTPPASARHGQFDHSHLNDDYFSRFDLNMDDYGSEPASVAMSPAIPVLELGPRATQSSLGGFVPLACAPEVDPGMARKLAQRAREREEREREEREREREEREKEAERERQSKLGVELEPPKSSRDVMVDALMAA